MDKGSNRASSLVTSPVFLLFLISIISFGFIAYTDRYLYQIFESIFKPLAIIADLRLTSLSIVFVAYLWLRKKYLLNFSAIKENQKRTLVLAAIWLIATAYFVLIKKVWVPTLKDWIDYVAFMITGLIAEEILFRGIIFDLSTKVFGDKKLLSFSMPVLFSAVVFGLQHLAYHKFEINAASITQVIYTTFTGIVFARIKESTGSLYWVILFHMINNSFTVIRNLG